MLTLYFYYYCFIVSISYRAFCDSSTQHTTNNPSFSDQYQTVTLSRDQGIRGFANFSGTGIQTFLGIPYALPPTGNRRFAKPTPMPPWVGIRDALSLSPKCLQTNVWAGGESEDCLYLNVFTPDTQGSNPVMVWIHGGGFSYGSGVAWDGTRLSGKGVVVVTFNYRLSVLGFASTGDEVMPGNYGMLDQVLVLKWVQKNINAFGGDPRRVTVFGYSAGATSISLHVMSPLSNGLFHRAIMGSGSAFSMWGLEREKSLPSPIETTRTIASSLRCPSGVNSSALLDCMRQVDGGSLVLTGLYLQWATNTWFLFFPRVESTFGFLPNYPEALLREGQFQNIESLVGFNSGEAAQLIHQRFPKVKDYLSRDEFKEGLFSIFTWSSFKSEEDIVDRLTDLYLKNETDQRTILSKLREAANDLFQMPVLLQLQQVLLHQTRPVKHRLFQLDHIPQSIQTPRDRGLPHAVERTLIFYSDAKTTMFSSYNDIPILTPEDVKFADRVQTMWTNFAKDGIPIDVNQGETSSWPDYTSQTPWMAHIDINLHYTPYTKKHEADIYWDFIRHINGSDNSLT